MSYKNLLRGVIACSAVALSFATYSSEVVDFDVNKSDWKKMDMGSKFPQVLVINKTKPVYYQLGASKKEFVELLMSRELAEETNSSASSWHKVKQMPEVDRLLTSDDADEWVFIISPDKSLFDCTACNVQLASLTSYAENHDVRLVVINIK